MFPVLPFGFRGGGKKGPLVISALLNSSQGPTHVANMGAGGSDCYAMVVVVEGDSGPVAPTSVTVGGVALTKVADFISTSYRKSFWFGPCPSGSQTVARVGGTSTDWAMFTYRVSGSDTPSFYGSSQSASTTTPSWNMPKGGALFVGTYALNATTWAGVASRDLITYTTSSAFSCAYASTAAAETPHNLTSSVACVQAGCVIQP